MSSIIKFSVRATPQVIIGVYSREFPKYENFFKQRRFTILDLNSAALNALYGIYTAMGIENAHEYVIGQSRNNKLPKLDLPSNLVTESLIEWGRKIHPNFWLECANSRLQTLNPTSEGKLLVAVEITNKAEFKWVIAKGITITDNTKVPLTGCEFDYIISSMDKLEEVVNANS